MKFLILFFVFFVVSASAVPSHLSDQDIRSSELMMMIFILLLIISCLLSLYSFFSVEIESFFCFVFHVFADLNLYFVSFGFVLLILCYLA